MHAVGFEPTIAAGEQPQTYDLDRAATGTSIIMHSIYNFQVFCCEITFNTLYQPLYLSNHFLARVLV
jgi:hypothetical protein